MWICANKTIFFCLFVLYKIKSINCNKKNVFFIQNSMNVCVFLFLGNDQCLVRFILIVQIKNENEYTVVKKCERKTNLIVKSWTVHENSK